MTVFTVSLGILIVAAAMGFARTFGSVRTFDQEVVPRQADAIAVVTAESDFKKQVQEWKDTLLRGGDSAALEKYWGNFEKRESDVRAEVDRLLVSVGDPETLKLIRGFLSAHKEMGEAYRRGLQQFKDAKFDSKIGDRAVAGMDREPTRLLTEAKERIIQLANVQAAEAAEGAKLSVQLAFAMMGAAAIGAALIFLLIVQRSVTRPLTHVAGVLTSLADGCTTASIEGLDRADEIGSVSRASDILRKNEIVRRDLEATIKAENEAAIERAQKMELLNSEFDRATSRTIAILVTAAGELQTTAAVMAEGSASATQQSNSAAAAADSAACNVSTVASATEELSSSIQEISRQVAQSTLIAGQAVDEAGETKSTIRTLADAAQEIGKVVGLINDIASQTNLLALNATIEAARAGDAGKGFAVVASEVKTLANQTARATENIIAQISSMQTATGDAVSAIDRIDRTIGQMNQISSAIAAAVEQQGAATQEIARNVVQASRDTSEVSHNISGMNQMVAETESAANKVLIASNELGQQAGILRDDAAQYLEKIRAL